MPQFSDIRGQTAAHDTLRSAAARGRLPHAMLFHGTEGVGKTSTAFALAQFLNCDSPGAEDSCGECRPCHKFAHLQHADLHWVLPMETAYKGGKRADRIRTLMDERLEPGIVRLQFARAASIAIGRDNDTRPGSVAELRHQAGMAPMEAKVKVFVVTLADRMTVQAANSLLKVLEEPPPDNLIILTTSKPGALLDTIVSRCQAVRFRDLAEDDMVTLLGERVDAEERSAVLAAGLSRGSLSRAASYLEEGVIEPRDTAVEFLSLSPEDPRASIAVEELARARDRIAVGKIIDFGLLWQADLLRLVTGSDVALANRDREDDLRAEAAGLDAGAVHRRIAALEEARRAMEGNVFLDLVLHHLINQYSGDPAYS